MKLSLPLIGGGALACLALLAYIFLNSKEVVQVGSIKESAITKVKGKYNYSKDLVLLKDEIFNLHNNVLSIEEKVILLEKKSALEKQDLFQALYLLRQDISKLKKQLEENNAPVIDTDQNTGLPSENSDITEQTLLEETRKANLKIKEYWDKVSGDFQLESIDTQWSMNAAQTITDSFDNIPGIDAQISQIDCRTSQCFVETNLKSQADVNKFTIIFPMKVSGLLSGINYQYTPHEDGSVTVSMYLTKSK